MAQINQKMLSNDLKVKNTIKKANYLHKIHIGTTHINLNRLQTPLAIMMSQKQTDNRYCLIYSLFLNLKYENEEKD